MKIACISTSRVPSSTANSIQMMKVCHALTQTGNTVRLWVPGDTPVEWPELAGHYGLTRPFDIRWLRSVRFLKRYDFTWQAVVQAQRWGAECIYTWMPQAAVLGLRRGLPVILEIHDRITGRLGPWLFNRFIHSDGKKRILVITQALLNKLQAGFAGLEGMDIRVAPNGVDPDQYAGLPDTVTARAQLGFPEMLTAVYSGHFYAGRGVDLLVELAAAFPRISFVWVGGRTADLEAIQPRLLDRGLDNVVLTGFIENRKLPLYQAAGDILLMPYELSIAGSSGGNSAEICSPMKMFDYMAAGRAILSSDLPVFHEVLSSENAVLAEAENIDAWKKALGNLIDNPDLRQKLGDQARRDAANFSWRMRAEGALRDFA